MLIILFLTLRSFFNPSPEEYVVRRHVAEFTLEIARSLRTDNTKHTYIRMSFRGDVFRFLFGDCNKSLLYQHDFDPQYFTPV